MCVVDSLLLVCVCLVIYIFINANINNRNDEFSLGNLQEEKGESERSPIAELLNWWPSFVYQKKSGAQCVCVLTALC